MPCDPECGSISKSPSYPGPAKRRYNAEKALSSVRSRYRWADIGQVRGRNSCRLPYRNLLNSDRNKSSWIFSFSLTHSFSLCVVGVCVSLSTPVHHHLGQQEGPAAQQEHRHRKAAHRMTLRAPPRRLTPPPSSLFTAIAPVKRVNSAIRGSDRGLEEGLRSAMM